MYKKVILALILSFEFYGCAYAIENNIDLTAMTAVAEKGDPQAQYKLGQLYEKGQSISRDYSIAMQWYKKSADQGNAAAQCAIGWMYENGLGVTKSDAEALNWYLKAANQSNPRAQIELSKMYRTGQGVAQSNEESISWLKKAVDQNFPAAQYEFGLMNYNGRVIPQSYMQAVDWYRKAAMQNYAPAEYSLAFMLGKGLGVPQDQTEAFNWVLKAAELNLPQAEWSASLMYEKGIGVAQNLDQAKFWHNKAITAEFVPSKEQLAQNLNSQATIEVRTQSQNKQLDPDRITHINRAYLANNFHPLKILQAGPIIYPKNSLAKREFGDVVVWPSVNEEGKVTNVTIHVSSGYEDLDMAAKDAAMHNIYAPYIDPDTGEARAVQTELIVTFKLPDMETTPLPSVIPLAHSNQTFQVTTDSAIRPIGQDVSLNMHPNQSLFEIQKDYHLLHIIQAGKVIYPSDTARDHEFGKVVLWLKVDDKGKVTDAKVHLSSGFSGLDMAAQFAAYQTIYAPFVDLSTGKTRATETALDIDFPKVTALAPKPAQGKMQMLSTLSSDVNVASCLSPEPQALARIHELMTGINVNEVTDHIGTPVLITAAIRAKYDSHATLDEVAPVFLRSNALNNITINPNFNVQQNAHIEYKSKDSDERSTFDGDNALEFVSIRKSLESLGHAIRAAQYTDASVLLQKSDVGGENVAFNVNAKTNNWSLLLLSTAKNVYFLYGNGKVCPISRSSFAQQYSHSFFMVMK